MVRQTIEENPSDEPHLAGAHELDSDNAFWALHDEVQVLGKGSYGTVKLVRVKSNNNLVAVKAVTKGASPAEDGIDERKEAEALLRLSTGDNANTAPARIGGRRGRHSRQGSRLSLLELQEELRSAAVNGKHNPGTSPKTVVGSLAPTLSPGSALSPGAPPTVRRSATLGTVSGAAASSSSGQRRSSSSRRSPHSMNVWQLQAALFGGGPTGAAATEGGSATADTAVEEDLEEDLESLAPAEAREGVTSPVSEADGANESDSSDSSDTVRLLDVYESPGTLFLVMRAELGGDLASRLATLPGEHCPEDEARTHAMALLRAIAGMHAKGVVHRDIKPANVLLSQEGEGRLGDFGLAETLPPAEGVAPQPLLTAVCGTHNNMAPEMVRCGHGEAAGYGTPADMWQMGLLTYELLFGRHPVARETEIETLAAILAADYSFPAASGVSEEARDLLRRLLVTDPAERLTAAECLLHPWIVGAPDVMVM